MIARMVAVCCGTGVQFSKGVIVQCWECVSIYVCGTEVDVRYVGVQEVTTQYQVARGKG